MNGWRYYCRGYLRLRLTSHSPERFLNMCAHHQIPVWELQHVDGCYEMYVSLTGFYEMKSICKKTGSKVKILKKHGLPFFFYRNKKRKAFFSGIFLFFCLLMLLSCFIWNIHISGNLHNSTQTILHYLDEIDVRHGVLKNKVDCSYIAEQLRKEFPDITWVSAKISGTRLILEVKENSTAGKEITAVQENPCNLVADKDGKIVSMITRKGIPCKKTGDTCSKGEVLVSGRLEIKNDSQEVVRYDYTDADADIYIESTLQYYQEFPLTYQKAVYSGETKKGYVLRLGEYHLLLKRKNKWPQYDTVTDLHQLRLTENFRLPLFYGTSKDYAYEMQTFTYSKEEAEKKAQKQLSGLLESLTEKGVQISENHVKIEVRKSSCVAKGSLSIIEKAGTKAPVEVTEQPTERNPDLDE